MVHIEDIPPEILEYILCFVSPYDDLKSCKLVCRKWNESCSGVVKKRQALFYKALKSGILEWQTPPTSSSHISITQRYSHSACTHGSYMYVFGGCTTSNTTFNDLWRYHLGRNEWMRLLTTGTYPSPKAYATMVTWKDSLVLFGGWTHPSLYPLHQQWVLFNEFHIYDIHSNRWSQIYFDYSPPPTAGHTATIHGDILVVFGGLQKTDSVSCSTNDIYCLNLLNNKWFKPLVSSEKPLPRYGHSQIKVNERHILIMSGCGGSNKLYSDVWLLTLPENPSDPFETWQWDSIEIKNAENMPSQIWYNPATKVENHIVIFCSWSVQKSQNNAPSGKMYQLLVPASVRMHSSNARVIPPHMQPQHRPQIGPFNQDDWEVNVNGQRGSFRNAQMNEAAAPLNNYEPEALQGRVRPSIRPNASSDRERMLQALSRMEKRIRTRAGSPMGGESSKTKAGSKPRNQNILVPHLLDIEAVISCKVVTWLPISLDKSGNPPIVGMSPSSCLLYSLLNGRGHLIMFGGIPNDMHISEHQEAVTNRVNIISTPFTHLNVRDS